MPHTSQEKNLIKSLARETLVQLAPEELPIFEPVFEQCMATKDWETLIKKSGEHPIATNLGEILLALTPAITSTIIVIFSLKIIREQNLHAKQQITASVFRPDNIRVHTHLSFYKVGIQQLQATLGINHPAYLEVLDYEQQLFENLYLVDRSGDNETRRSTRNEILSRLNRISITHLNTSFNDLCGMTQRVNTPRLTDTQYQEFRVFQQAHRDSVSSLQELGYSEEVANRVFLTVAKVLGQVDED